MKIFGVEILNEGWGTSVDDSVNEMQATFVARLVGRFSSMAYPGAGAVALARGG